MSREMNLVYVPEADFRPLHRARLAAACVMVFVFSLLVAIAPSGPDATGTGLSAVSAAAQTE